MYGDAWKNAGKGGRGVRVAAHIALGAVIMTALAGGLGYVVMVLWNAIMPEVTGVRPVSFWQAVGLLALARLLVGGFSRGRCCYRKPRWGRRHDPRRMNAVLDDFVEKGRADDVRRESR